MCFFCVKKWRVIEMLSENLKRIRTEQRYNRKQLANESGISSATIQFIENGTIDNPKIKTVLALAKVLKVSITTLIK